MLANVKKTSLVAAFGIGLPFAMGFGLAAYLYDVRAHTYLETRTDGDWGYGKHLANPHTYNDDGNHDSA